MKSQQLVIVLATLLGTHTAWAAEGARSDETSPPAATELARKGAESGHYLPGTLTPNVGATRATAAVVSGYDGARKSGVISASADVAIWGPIAVRVGATFMPQPMAETGAARWQPNFGARVQVLRQDRHGLDGAVGVYYRKERFTQDEGEIQVVMMGGLRLGRVGLFANVGYGQDPEGDDRDGLVNLAALYTAGTHLQLGVDGRLRFDLMSSDTRRTARGESGYDLLVGPVAAVPLGPWALVTQLGYSAVHTQALQMGVVALGGFGRSF